MRAVDLLIKNIRGQTHLVGDTPEKSGVERKQVIGGIGAQMFRN